MQLTAFHSLSEALLAQIQAHPEQTCFCFLGADQKAQKITYAELGMDIERVAGLLRRQDVQPGELAILLFQHSYELVVAFFGAMACGAVPTIFPYYTPHALTNSYQHRLQALLRQTGAHQVLTTQALYTGVFQLVADPSCQVTAVDSPGAVDNAIFDLHSVADVEATAYIQFSSGTTGTPRGVVISQRAALHNVAALAQAWSFNAGDVSVGWLPFFHDMGLVTNLLLPLLVGGQSVTMPPEFWLRRPIALLRAVHEYGGVMTWMPNFAFAHCVRHIDEQEVDGLDLSRWRMLGSGSEPVQFETLQRFAERFAVCGFKPTALTAGYGMAENVVGVTHAGGQGGIQTDWISQTILQAEKRAQPTAPTATDAQAIVACGRPFPGVEVAILDDNDYQLAARQVGEIVIRGTSLFSGYYQQREATAAPRTAGWFHTGDIGYLADNQLYVLDRKKDLIISGGKNISPHAIETIAQRVLGPQLHRVAAFGIYDQMLGTEAPVLVCELRKRLDLAEQERYAAQVKQQVRESCDLVLADLRFVPRGLIEVTTSGKIARAATRQNYQKAGFAPIGALFTGEETPTRESAAWEAVLQQLFAQVIGTVKPDIHSPFGELGVDSLALMRFLLGLEETMGRPVSIERLAHKPTIAHLAHLLSHAPEGTVSEPLLVPENDRYAIPKPPTGRLSASNHRRWLHYHLLHRGPQLRRQPLPYRLGTRILHQLTRPSPWRDQLFLKEIELLQCCLAQIEVTRNPAVVIQQSLMVNTWPLWRSQALANQAHFQRWVSIHGIDRLNKASTQSRGLIIAFPHTYLRLFLFQLPPFHEREISIIGNLGPKTLAQIGLSHLAQAMAQGQTLSKIAVRAQQLQHAHHVLTRGGIVIVFADDTEGKGGIQMPFHGRLRPFRPGIAELALQSGAAIVPTFATMQLSGHIRFEFLEPLTVQAGDRTQQMVDLLQQYAVVLAEQWQHDFSSMEWFVLRDFLAFQPYTNNREGNCEDNRDDLLKTNR